MRHVVPLLLVLACGAPSDGSTDEDSSGSAASAPTGGEVNFDCDGYCTRITASCTGLHAQYPNKETCLATCAYFDVGEESDQAGNTLGCRLYHAGVAGEDPATHCTHAGPGGNNNCGSNCDGFCTIAVGACPDLWPDLAMCTSTCADIGDAEPFDAGDVSGDSLACRLYHLEVATLKPAEHCGHTLPMSVTCN